MKPVEPRPADEPTIPEAAVEAAARALRGHGWLSSWPAPESVARAALAAAEPLMRWSTVEIMAGVDEQRKALVEEVARLREALNCAPFPGPTDDDPVDLDEERLRLRTAEELVSKGHLIEAAGVLYGCQSRVARAALAAAEPLMHDSRITNLRAENARLREALEKIASCHSSTPGTVVAIARAALAPSDEEAT